MFRQHKILCENKETVIYLFLYDQQIDLDTMKNIFSQISNMTLESRIIDYFNQHISQPLLKIYSSINIVSQDLTPQM